MRISASLMELAGTVITQYFLLLEFPASLTILSCIALLRACVVTVNSLLLLQQLAHSVWDTFDIMSTSVMFVFSIFGLLC